MSATSRRTLPAIIALFLLICGSAVLAGGGLAGPGTYDLSWNTVDGGGGTSTGGAFELSGTIGQPDAGGPMTGGGFELNGGFWPGAVVGPVCTGDIAQPHNHSVDVNDLLAVVSTWGTCPGPCPPHCLADVAPPGGDCVVNVNDLLAVITTWGPCP